MSPPINFNKVDFPQPLGPTKETHCPGEMEKLTSRNASIATVPRRVRNTFPTFSISIASVHAPALLCLCRDSVLSMKSHGCCDSRWLLVGYIAMKGDAPYCWRHCMVYGRSTRHQWPASNPPIERRIVADSSPQYPPSLTIDTEGMAPGIIPLGSFIAISTCAGSKRRSCPTFRRSLPT